MLLVLLFAMTGCGGDDRSDPYVGNMDDFSYGGRRGKLYGPTASGERLKLADFKGRFVWIDFAAPWCGPCMRQAPIIKQLEKKYGKDVVFLTMVTSDSQPGVRASQATAQRWAKQHGLDPRHVMPTDEWGRVIPQHVVLSPLGQTLDWQVGLRNDVQIRSTIAKHMREWRAWYAENKDSPSVILSEINL